mmetsp:Transcript_22296/g.55948  ORF Transcript_22296/g.55948 Transcript_22296/m.55948 type:complete len:247 (-) Transcript_22296:367-1107(-)
MDARGRRRGYRRSHEQFRGPNNFLHCIGRQRADGGPAGKGVLLAGAVAEALDGLCQGQKLQADLLAHVPAWLVERVCRFFSSRQVSAHRLHSLQRQLQQRLDATEQNALHAKGLLVEHDAAHSVLEMREALYERRTVSELLVGAHAVGARLAHVRDSLRHAADALHRVQVERVRAGAHEPAHRAIHLRQLLLSRIRWGGSGCSAQQGVQLTQRLGGGGCGGGCGSRCAGLLWKGHCDGSQCIQVAL